MNPHEDPQQDTVLQHAEYCQRHKLITADISNEQAVKKAIEESAAFLDNSINCLVNNAGMVSTSAFRNEFHSESMTPDDA